MKKFTSHQMEEQTIVQIQKEYGCKAPDRRWCDFDIRRGIIKDVYIVADGKLEGTKPTYSP
jgi:hypothetical protein